MRDECLGGNGEQQEESEVTQTPSTEATHQKEDTTSSVDMEILENNDQLKENSCIIVERILSSEPVHRIEGATSSEFELGMTAAPSSIHQTMVDSPIKVKVTEEFSQDTFSPLNIQGIHQIFLCVYFTVLPLYSTRSRYEQWNTSHSPNKVVLFSLHMPFNMCFRYIPCT